MSNRNPDESSGHRKPKVSLAMLISQGLGGPKVKPKGVADGQPVNIPAHLLDKIQMTQSKFLERLLDSEAEQSVVPKIRLPRKF
jgi:hypothetical protein